MNRGRTGLRFVATRPLDGAGWERCPRAEHPVITGTKPIAATTLAVVLLGPGRNEENGARPPRRSTAARLAAASALPKRPYVSDARSSGREHQIPAQMLPGYQMPMGRRCQMLAA